MADGHKSHRHRRILDIRQAEFLKQASGTLGSGDLRNAVKLPQGEDLNEWLAMNGWFFPHYVYLYILFSVVDFFNQVTMLYGTITDKCTDESCPSMTAGKMEYTWTERDRSVKCTAPVYIDYLFSSVQDEIDDENIFPSQIGR